MLGCFGGGGGGVDPGEALAGAGGTSAAGSGSAGEPGGDDIGYDVYEDPDSETVIMGFENGEIFGVTGNAIHWDDGEGSYPTSGPGRVCNDYPHPHPPSA